MIASRPPTGVPTCSLSAENSWPTGQAILRFPNPRRAGYTHAHGHRSYFHVVQAPQPSNVADNPIGTGFPRIRQIPVSDGLSIGESAGHVYEQVVNLAPMFRKCGMRIIVGQLPAQVCVEG